MFGPVRSVLILNASAVALVIVSLAAGFEPPGINPFGSTDAVRDDAVPGYLELSDGTVRVGQIYLTRDAKLKVFDDTQKRQREVPLTVVKRVDCGIDREWLEKEWRFKENANDEKVYTGRSYPVREYLHTVILLDGRAIKGPMSALVYVQPEGGGEPEKFLLHKRDKGPIGVDLNRLIYVRSIRLGADAQEEGRRRAAGAARAPGSGQDKGARRAAAPGAKAKERARGAVPAPR
jgi:hypothetical protein